MAPDIVSRHLMQKSPTAALFFNVAYSTKAVATWCSMLIVVGGWVSLEESCYVCGSVCTPYLSVMFQPSTHRSFAPVLPSMLVQACFVVWLAGLLTVRMCDSSELRKTTYTRYVNTHMCMQHVYIHTCVYMLPGLDWGYAVWLMRCVTFCVALAEVCMQT